jgi:pheromone shutdown-related protein TraB
MNVKLIGTSHIAKQSVKEIKDAFETFIPDIVAVELDVNRAISLMQEQKSKVSIAVISKIGIKGYLFAKIGQVVQQKLGKLVGVSPGSEMKTALHLAAKNKVNVAFIDQPINITLKNFSKNLTWKEKFRFVGDMVKGLIFPKRQIKQYGLENFDLSKVPSSAVVKKMIKQMKDRYPNVYKTLVEDRNKYMFKNIVKLVKKDPEKKILVIVGAGHEDGINEMLLKVDVVKEFQKAIPLTDK